MMLFGGAGIGQNMEEVLTAFIGTKTTGNLGLDLNHAKITLRLIIVKRDGEILDKQAYRILVFPQPVNQGKNLSPLAATFSAG